MALFDRISDDNIDDTTVLFCEIENSERLQNFTEYVIRVQRGYGPNKDSWTVKHRYKDFVQLNEDLAVSGLALPLPPKKLIGNTQREFVAKRSQELQTYLSVVLSHPLLSMSIPVKKFLDPKEYSSDFRARALQALSVCLRSLSGWSVSEPWEQANWRLRKHFFFVKHSEQPKAKQVLTWSYFGPDWYLSSKDTLILLDYFSKLQHPYLWNPEFAWCNEDGALVIRQFLPEGTLRDQMTKARPCANFLKKYSSPKTVFPLDVDDIRHICRHILEALRFLQKIGLPYGQLHCGNLAVTESGCQLLDVEDGIFGLPSFYRPFFVQLKAVSSVESADVYCFGQTLYEMAMGEPLNGPVLPKEGPPVDCPRNLRNLLISLLSAEATSSTLPTVEELLQTDLFRHVPFAQGPKEFRISARVKEILQKCRKQIERRLYDDQKEFRHSVKSKKVSAYFNSDEQKKERRKLMKQWTNEGVKPLSLDETRTPAEDLMVTVKSPETCTTKTEVGVLAPSPFAPPPAPPVPDFTSLNVKTETGVRPSAGSDRSAVMDSIRSFQKNSLKKTETKDRSAPKI